MFTDEQQNDREHGPECTCGCHDSQYEHEHEHNHEHNHSHRHEREHDSAHETLESQHCVVDLEAHTHEETATVSMEIMPRKNTTLVFGNIVELMVTIAGEIEAANGIVGHIKAFARQGDTFAHASVTASYLDPECEGDLGIHLNASTTVQLAAIALLISQEQLLDLCRKEIGARL